MRSPLLLLLLLFAFARAETCHLRDTTALSRQIVASTYLGGAYATWDQIRENTAEIRFALEAPPKESAFLTHLPNPNDTNLSFDLWVAVSARQGAMPVEPNLDISIDLRWTLRDSNTTELRIATPWSKRADACRYVWCDALKRENWGNGPSAFEDINDALDAIDREDPMFADLVFSPGACVTVVCAADYHDEKEGLTSSSSSSSTFAIPRLGDAGSVHLEAIVTGKGREYPVRVWTLDPSTQMRMGGDPMWQIQMLDASHPDRPLDEGNVVARRPVLRLDAKADCAAPNPDDHGLPEPATTNLVGGEDARMEATGIASAGIAVMGVVTGVGALLYAVQRRRANAARGYRQTGMETIVGGEEGSGNIIDKEQQQPEASSSSSSPPPPPQSNDGPFSTRVFRRVHGWVARMRFSPTWTWNRKESATTSTPLLMLTLASESESSEVVVSRDTYDDQRIQQDAADESSRLHIVDLQKQEHGEQETALKKND